MTGELSGSRRTTQEIILKRRMFGTIVDRRRRRRGGLVQKPNGQSAEKAGGEKRVIISPDDMSREFNQRGKAGLHLGKAGNDEGENENLADDDGEQGRQCHPPRWFFPER